MLEVDNFARRSFSSLQLNMTERFDMSKQWMTVKWVAVVVVFVVAAVAAAAAAAVFAAFVAVVDVASVVVVVVVVVAVVAVAVVAAAVVFVAVVVSVGSVVRSWGQQGDYRRQHSMQPRFPPPASSFCEIDDENDFLRL